MVASDTGTGTGTLEFSTLAPNGALTADVEDSITAGLIASLPTLKMGALFAHRRDMFREADLITVATDTTDRTVIGALSSRWCTTPSGGRFLHILTQFVGERYQGGIAFPRSWGSHFAQLYGDWSQFPDLLVLKTYNPIVYCVMRAFTRVPGVTFYPEIREGRHDPDAAARAVEVAEIVAPDHPFDPATGVISGIGEPPDLYPALPQSRNAQVNEYFSAYARPGDRILCMLSVPTPDAAGTILDVFGVTPKTSPVHMARSGMVGLPAGTDGRNGQ
ncbi:MAG TPA: hypothetical protein VFU43_15780 [Streptosporangiaceae bacterium]|nr:hypothetical protein [Streptosporangiaceae bacterium]